MTTVTGPFVKSADLPEYTVRLAEILQEEAVEHIRTAAQAALTLLTSPDSAAMTLRAVCSMARVDPYVPLVESLPAVFAGWAQHESVATLEPVKGGWVIVQASEPVRKAAALLGDAKNRAVTGPGLQLTFDTGYPRWLSTEELAEAIGVDTETLTATPAQIRDLPGLPAGPATSGLILRLLEDNTFAMREQDARRHELESRAMLWHMASDSYLAAGQQIPDVVAGVRGEKEIMDAALRRFRTANPDPTDLDAAVKLAVELVYEAGQARLTRDLVRSDRRTGRVRTPHAAPKQRPMVNGRGR